MIVDINGNVHIYWNSQSLCVDLKEFIDEENVEEPFSLELVASDVILKCNVENLEISDEHSESTGANNLGYIATWLFAPKRYFAAFFQFFCNFSMQMWSKFDIINAPTYTRLTTTSPTDVENLYWLIFSYSKGVQAYSIDKDNNDVKPILSIEEIFPVLEITDLPGSAIRSHCWICNKYKFSVVGYDTGYVIGSVCTMQDGIIADRKTLKFNGPISVLKITNENPKEMISSVLVSSTLGPAAIWSLKLQEDTLTWSIKTILLDSDRYDTIITGYVTQDYIMIGTYGEVCILT